MAPQGAPHGTPFGTKNTQKSSAGVPWEGLGRHLRNSCKKRAPLEGRTCNPLMPVQSKHSFQCSDFSYFWHQICPTFGSSCAPFRPQCLKKAVLKITQKSTPKKCRKCSKITSFGTPCGGVHQVTFLMVFRIWAPGDAQEASRRAPKPPGAVQEALCRARSARRRDPQNCPVNKACPNLQPAPRRPCPTGRVLIKIKCNNRTEV